jgi:hypothetical protein
MSQEKVFNFLKENKDTWFNIPLIVSGIIYKNDLETSCYSTQEVIIRRAIVKLMHSNNIKRKVFKIHTYYKYYKD